MKILGIETSCDDTSAAVLDNDKVLSNVISSQFELNKIYGGVMPEMASRAHLENITYIIDQALKNANVTLDEIDAIAVTEGPGLMGPLHVGLQAAKALSLAKNIPLIPVNHLSAHIYAVGIEKEIKYPALALLVSGGNTMFVYLKEKFHFHVIGQTADDAVGECYDKVARLLNLSYPGGPAIEKKALNGQAIYKLPIPKDDNTLDMSFSGLKSATNNLIRKFEQTKTDYKVEDVCASFEEAAIKTLVKKTGIALKHYKVNQMIVCGGVAANKHLIKELKKLFSKETEVISPSLTYCGDNAAMIAYLGVLQHARYKDRDLSIGINPNADLENIDNSMPYTKQLYHRIPLYLNVLKKLSENGETYVNSKRLAYELGDAFDSSTIRRDLADLKISGIQGLGYNIVFLEKYLKSEIGIPEKAEIALFGVGNMGKALIKYNFEKKGIGEIVVAFDSSPTATSINNVPIYNVSELNKYLKPTTKIALLAVPPSISQELMETLINKGFNIFLNFTGANLKTMSNKVVIKQIDLNEMIQETLCLYKLK